MVDMQIGEEGFGGSASSSQIQMDQQQTKDLMTFPTNTQSSMRKSHEEQNRSPSS